MPFQSQCPIISIAKKTSHSKTNKKGKYSKFEHLPSLYIVFNINIDGGGRGINFILSYNRKNYN
ncbi:hypothetical protein JMUB7487_26720 [Staphylococcus aureus]